MGLFLLLFKSSVATRVSLATAGDPATAILIGSGTIER